MRIDSPGWLVGFFFATFSLLGEIAYSLTKGNNMVVLHYSRLRVVYLFELTHKQEMNVQVAGLTWSEQAGRRSTAQ